MTIRSKEGAAKRYWALIRKYRRDYAGGGAFGFDWPTMRANVPDVYAELQAIKATYASLPSRNAVVS